ncbi:NAD(P)/FAD-dependent oxidoreductase [Microvirga sp. BSC39]|uniref:flavin monoamine oxidase family protein n=1 Tax=Microvirga sp. BSC39 TaxID=1549810 RepID=UPI0004E8D68C|nr:NAD(P)/FAD-dependent oxidoreductase [Microvirga sp. BSC39]KFG68092.1 amine oxidase [Microvirga sp. BSC39]
MNEAAAKREVGEPVPLKTETSITPAGDPDVIVIGAGSAGIAATRHLIARGLTVTILEARDRIGGRALTRSFKGHPVDLGAHWLHAGPINPLVKLGFERREPLRRAPVDGHFFVRGQPGSRADSAALDRAFAMADRAMNEGAKAREDQPAAKVLPPMGPQGRRVAAIHGLVSGRPLDQVSLHDFPSMEYADNLFIAGGLGAYVSRLARGLPIRLGAAVRSIDWSAQGVRVESTAGTLRGKAVIVTAPMAVLQQDTIRFTPALPNAVQEAVHGFTQGVYEHVVLHWPNSLFRGADRLASLTGTRREPPGLLTCIDGTPFHFFELDQPSAAGFDRRDAHAPFRFARAVLAEHFGHRAIRNLSALHSTAWRNDPWSRASWAVVPPGSYPIRDTLKAPVGERIWFAGEALSRAQWGTAGGAWEEGERAAEEIVRQLAR